MNICMPSQSAEIHRSTAPFDNVFLNPEFLTRPSDTGHDSRHCCQSDYSCANETTQSCSRPELANTIAIRAKAYDPKTFLIVHSTPEIKNKAMEICTPWQDLNVYLQGAPPLENTG
ncbi:hypothetical protein ABE527_20575 [Brucella sp. TWI432]